MDFQNSVIVVILLSVVLGMVVVLVVSGIILFLAAIEEIKKEHDWIFIRTENIKMRQRTDVFPGYVKNRMSFQPIDCDFFEELRKSTMLEI